ncbi:hypothetical protein VTN00DRAFT_9843 [Thermoascus crustaceus]|uniref:uncharacterized protein n=1 Tax=Thermoascus crustaceus TaxID=5088 RepID=UPI0037436589
MKGFSRDIGPNLTVRHWSQAWSTTGPQPYWVTARGCRTDDAGSPQPAPECGLGPQRCRWPASDRRAQLQRLPSLALLVGSSIAAPLMPYLTVSTAYLPGLHESCLANPLTDLDIFRAQECPPIASIEPRRAPFHLSPETRLNCAPLSH